LSNSTRKITQKSHLCEYSSNQPNIAREKNSDYACYAPEVAVKFDAVKVTLWAFLSDRLVAI